MKISVVIPAHNEEKYIENCLRSLTDQDYRDYEIIVCLNLCTDRTEEIAKKYKNVNIVKESRKGVAFARQTGSEAASGDIIASADADTVYPNNWLSRIAWNFNKRDKIVGLYGPVEIRESTLFLKIISLYVYTGFLYLSKFFNNDNVAGMNFACRKESFDNIGGYSVNLKSAEDIDLALRIKQYGNIGFDRKLIVYTSDRRFKGRFFESFPHHIRNYYRIFISKKAPEDFKDIR